MGTWPVQFIPAFSALTKEALKKAKIADFEGVPFRIVSAVDVAAIALSVGRPKDFYRVLALLDAGAVTQNEIAEIAERYGMIDSWARLKARFLHE